MKYRCEEGVNCKYGGEVDTEGGKAYILKAVGGETIAWHYLCRVNEAYEMVKIPVKEKLELKRYLSEAFGNDAPSWVERILQSL